MLDINDFYSRVGSLRAEKQKFLNDTYIWVNICIESLNCVNPSNNQYEVPKTVKTQRKIKNIERTNGKYLHLANNERYKLIQRSGDKFDKLINSATYKDLYYSTFVYIVGNVEDYFSKVVELLLEYDNNRLMCTVNGINFTNNYTVVEIVKSTDRQEIIKKIIQDRIVSIFYAKPSRYKDYFSKALSIEIDETYWFSWFEMKATRDLIVHNNGIINSIYIDKSSTKVRGSIGECIIVDSKYFEESISLLKSLIGQIDRQIRSCYLKGYKEKRSLLT